MQQEISGTCGISLGDLHFFAQILLFQLSTHVKIQFPGTDLPCAKPNLFVILKTREEIRVNKASNAVLTSKYSNVLPCATAVRFFFILATHFCIMFCNF